MISIGRSIRWYKNYESEIEFSINHGFEFMQIWFKDGMILVDNIPDPKYKYIKKFKFPIILHAVFTLKDFELYGDELLELTDYFGNKEVIIHPVCEEKFINSKTELELLKQTLIFSSKAKNKGITWYMENNSRKDIFHYKKMIWK